MTNQLDPGQILNLCLTVCLSPIERWFLISLAWTQGGNRLASCSQLKAEASVFLKLPLFWFSLPHRLFSLLTQSKDLPCPLHLSQPSLTLQFMGHHPLQLRHCSRQGKTLNARTPESREKGKSWEHFDLFQTCQIKQVWRFV